MSGDQIAPRQDKPSSFDRISPPISSHSDYLGKESEVMRSFSLLTRPVCSTASVNQTVLSRLHRNRRRRLPSFPAPCLHRPRITRAVSTNPRQAGGRLALRRTIQSSTRLLETSGARKARSPTLDRRLSLAYRTYSRHLHLGARANVPLPKA
jgi:hypothetical protein